MGGKLRDYAAAAEQAAGRDQQAVLAAFDAHFEAERRLQFDMPKMLVAARKQAGLSQQQLAELSGVGQSEISRLENGQANPTLDTLNRIVAPLQAHLVIVDSAGRPVVPAS